MHIRRCDKMFNALRITNSNIHNIHETCHEQMVTLNKDIRIVFWTGRETAAAGTCL